jgi:REP element-mobilizing transposase RayT
MPPATPPKNPDPRLSFSLVFAPRFPEHRLAGPMVGKLDQWARRLCLAWDWKAERVDVSDDALLLEVMLPPDIAPAYAAQRLSENLSSQILETFPHLEPGFPTGGFWASAHMLVSGTAVTPEQVAAFVSQLRQAQGRGD